jgi:hypothetical protein
MPLVQILERCDWAFHEKATVGAWVRESVKVFLEVKTRHVEKYWGPQEYDMERTTLTSSSSESSLSWIRASRRSCAECFKTP